MDPAGQGPEVGSGGGLADTLGGAERLSRRFQSRLLVDFSGSLNGGSGRTLLVIIGLRGAGRGDFAGLAKSTPNAKVYFGRFGHCRDTIRIHLQGFDSRKCSDIVRG